MQAADERRWLRPIEARFDVTTRGRSRMREPRSYGSVPGRRTIAAPTATFFLVCFQSVQEGDRSSQAAEKGVGGGVGGVILWAGVCGWWGGDAGKRCGRGLAVQLCGCGEAGARRPSAAGDPGDRHRDAVGDVSGVRRSEPGACGTATPATNLCISRYRTRTSSVTW